MKDRLNLENFKILEEFKGNSCNKIYLVVPKNDHQSEKVIYKTIKIYNFQSQLREIQAQKNLKHKYIIKLLDYEIQDKHIILLIEYSPKGDLFSFINNLDAIRESKLLRIFYKIVMAIHFIHLNGFIHRDIKPENILMDQNMEPKLADFGSSVSEDIVRNTFCGTYEYMAPEIYMRKKQSFKVDVWALGVLLFEMTHNKTPFKNKDVNEIEDMVRNDKIEFDRQISNKIKNIIRSILIFDPTKRPSTARILKFPELKRFYEEMKPELKSIYEVKKSEDLLRKTRSMVEDFAPNNFYKHLQTEKNLTLVNHKKFEQPSLERKPSIDHHIIDQKGNMYQLPEEDESEPCMIPPSNNMTSLKNLDNHPSNLNYEQNKNSSSNNFQNSLNSFNNLNRVFQQKYQMMTPEQTKPKEYNENFDKIKQMVSENKMKFENLKFDSKFDMFRFQSEQPGNFNFSKPQSKLNDLKSKVGSKFENNSEISKFKTGEKYFNKPNYNDSLKNKQLRKNYSNMTHAFTSLKPLPQSSSSKNFSKEISSRLQNIIHKNFKEDNPNDKMKTFKKSDQKEDNLHQQLTKASSMNKFTRIQNKVGQFNNSSQVNNYSNKFTSGVKKSCKKSRRKQFRVNSKDFKDFQKKFALKFKNKINNFKKDSKSFKNIQNVFTSSKQAKLKTRYSDLNTNEIHRAVSLFKNKCNKMTNIAHSDKNHSKPSNKKNSNQIPESPYDNYNNNTPSKILYKNNSSLIQTQGSQKISPVSGNSFLSPINDNNSMNNYSSHYQHNLGDKIKNSSFGTNGSHSNLLNFANYKQAQKNKNSTNDNGEYELLKNSSNKSFRPKTIVKSNSNGLNNYMSSNPPSSSDINSFYKNVSSMKRINTTRPIINEYFDHINN